MGCSSEKLATDREDGVMMGFHCEAEPRCLCFEMKSPNAIIVCEDKVFLSRRIGLGAPVYYVMECMGEIEIDPYHYLPMILYAHFSAPSIMYRDSARLDVSNCSAPSRSQSVLFGALSTGSIGGWRDLSLEILTIICQQSKNVHLSKQHLSGLKQLKRLILICPKLAKLDEDLLSGTSKRLEKLQIESTQVRDLPERFFADMEAMKSLYLRKNKLKSLGRSFLSSMRSLEIIDLSKNEIKSLDDDVFLQTEKLSHVQLSENLLTTLPTSLCSLRKLKFLLAEYNRITFIPQECLCNMPRLSLVSLKGNKLVTLGQAPTYKKVLSSNETFPNSSSIQEKPANLNNAWIGTSLIEDLCLGNNLLSSLPDDAFYGMDGLQFLNISSNRITYLPQDIFSRNKNLIELLASNSLFANVPAALLRNNTRLDKLDLSHNFIETLDLDFFSASTSLCYIYINDNRIRHLPNKIFKPFEGKRWGCKEFVLDMSRNLLEDVPELSLPLLTNLSLSENNLTWIKYDILWQAGNLKEVNISHNLIHTIDGRLELDEYHVLFENYLLNLEVIDLSSNRLTVLPSIAFFAKTLKHLNVSNNYITQFAFKPERRAREVKCLPFETFDMSGNSLKSVEFFGDRLWHFEKTRYVDLSRNRIELDGCFEHVYFPRLVWGCLTSLRRLPALEEVFTKKPDSVNGKAVAEVESWAYHWLPMIGLCGYDTGVEPLSGHTATNTTEMEAVVDPPT
ncbi:chaoptin-like [Ischnura elegans]|uniref:chaoptin-like n=1 Tax=Ischnura elegans TaxID=197161 RepID=UPI001ED8BE92|nr:chaoptin-like [Ischnura elegans]